MIAACFLSCTMFGMEPGTEMPKENSVAAQIMDAVRNHTLLPTPENRALVRAVYLAEWEKFNKNQYLLSPRMNPVSIQERSGEINEDDIQHIPCSNNTLWHHHIRPQNIHNDTNVRLLRYVTL